MLYQAMEFARPGTLVLLDDAHRDEEKFAISRWQEILGSAIEVHLLPGFPKGLAAITIIEPICATQLPQRATNSILRKLRSLIQPDSTWIVVDDGVLEPQAYNNSSVLPFIEHDGEYWGPPASDEQAIVELTRLRDAGASFLAIVSSSFWWLDHYRQFNDYLESTFHCDVRDDDLVVFDMRNEK